MRHITAFKIAFKLVGFWTSRFCVVFRWIVQKYQQLSDIFVSCVCDVDKTIRTLAIVAIVITASYHPTAITAITTTTLKCHSIAFAIFTSYFTSIHFKQIKIIYNVLSVNRVYDQREIVICCSMFIAKDVLIALSTESYKVIGNFRNLYASAVLWWTRNKMK